VSEYIRFTCECRGAGRPLELFDGFVELSTCRRKLLLLRLIGVDANGIGFGNISIKSKTRHHPNEIAKASLFSCRGGASPASQRPGIIDLRDSPTASQSSALHTALQPQGTDSNNFFITGSATGGLPELRLADCAKVVAFDFKKNWLQYEGSAVPSSESLTHAAVYASDENAGAVIHCHALRLWSALLPVVPATAAKAEHGTSEMAGEVTRLFEEIDLRERKILVMAGHEGGIMTFGKDLGEAFTVLMREWQRCSPRAGNQSGDRWQVVRHG
jgi:ribulose-5-phosphate 4-epimerase/fuculose-1-phosphate aldolase